MTSLNRKPTHLQAYYDSIWSSPHPERPVQEEILTRLHFQTSCRAFALECLGPLKGQRILEIGPGRGQETLLFAREGAQVYALDISSKSLELIKNLAKAHGVSAQITLIHADAERLPFRGGTFTRVFAQTTLMHTDFLQVARESARVLSPGGKAVFMEPLRSNPFLYLYRTLCSEFRSTAPCYLRLRDVRQMGRYFKAYFHREFYLTALIGLYLTEEKKTHREIKRNLERLDNWLTHKLPFLRSFCWMTVMSFEK